ncbi:hypothetical protein BGX28_007765 [Mortierella sp. GBA30]|nr:hypothetical protein BGX28_007765 [Mortierella sp. GBA30]
MGDTQDESEKQWAVYSQLARLNKLTHLSIGGKCSSGAMNGASGMASSLTTTTTTGASIPGARDEEAIVGADGLALRLCSGLGQLHTLKELRVLRFTGLEQHLKDEDVEWMVENLPQLRVVQGRLHPDEQCQPRLDAILEKAEISTWTMYNHQHSPCRSQN